MKTPIPTIYAEAIFIFVILMVAFLHSEKQRKKNSNVEINYSETEHETDWDNYGLCKRMSIEKFRSFSGCGHYTDDEAQKIIESLHQLGLIAFNTYIGREQTNIYISK